MNYLIVEDELLIQKSLKKLIQRRGGIVHTTASGIEAISLIKENTYSRIICDLMLTDITGFDIIEESKSRFSGQEIREKFIIITAYSSSQVLEKAHEYGCKVIKKPFGNIKETIDIFMEKNEKKADK